MITSSKFALGGLVTWFVLLLLSIPAWITHVVSCIKHDQWAFLIAGAIAFPIAVLHGWYIWALSFISLFQ